MILEKLIAKNTLLAIKELYKKNVNEKIVNVLPTRKDLKGDFTIVVFPFLRFSKKNAFETAKEIGGFLFAKMEEIKDFEVVNGFLNLFISDFYWISFLNSISKNKNFGHKKTDEKSKAILVEYSSPNTNKPLHLGHIRNNLLGYSISQILKANGKNVKMVNLVNDRGIHICKSILAWKKFGKNKNPKNSNLKGDHFVGKYYVRFEKEYKKEVAEMLENGVPEKEAKKNAKILLEAQEILRKWENNDKEIIDIWREMNNWVYKGFDETYKKMGIYFDKIYYESETYLRGKKIVLDALNKNIFFQKNDNSIWVDLKKDKLDDKILLRSDGTSVYITQDIGTANLRFEDYDFEKMIYVVGNEQNYHFKVLYKILEKLNFSYVKNLKHFSYGMVELPDGKMKSREGTVVDADDLMKEMFEMAKNISEKLDKLNDFTTEEKKEIYEITSLGALKYFILKVDPKKNISFDPKESIDFNGNTAPFIQYTYARINSIFRNLEKENFSMSEINTNLKLNEKEKEILKKINNYPKVIFEAGKNYSPALIANYVYDIVKEYNQFYQKIPILKEKNIFLKNFRLFLSKKVSEIIKDAFTLLGINVPKAM